MWYGCSSTSAGRGWCCCIRLDSSTRVQSDHAHCRPVSRPDAIISGETRNVGKMGDVSPVSQSVIAIPGTARCEQSLGEARWRGCREGVAPSVHVRANLRQTVPDCPCLPRRSAANRGDPGCVPPSVSLRRACCCCFGLRCRRFLALACAAITSVMRVELRACPSRPAHLLRIPSRRHPHRPTL